ncbi:GAF domain-containing protein [Arthrobacter antioxidans]|uniref:GAF domain-containing protein n=1 Tax=Arthrobacter antioxidans TaxID=2895818 RepID=UPI003AF1B882
MARPDFLGAGTSSTSSEEASSTTTTFSFLQARPHSRPPPGCRPQLIVPYSRSVNATEHLAGHGQDVFCGAILLRPRNTVTIASSSPESRRLDELQYSYGPCLTAARTDQPVHVDDTRTDQRWPEYVADVTRHAMSSILGMPIPLDGDAECGLNLYSTAPNTFTSRRSHAAHGLERCSRPSRELPQAFRALPEPGAPAGVIGRLCRGPVRRPRASVDHRPGCKTLLEGSGACTEPSELA